MDELPYEAVRGDGVLLRPPRESDAESIAAACADPAIQRFLPRLPAPYTRDDALNWIAQARARLDQRTLVVADPVTDQVIGSCGLHRLTPIDRIGEVGYWVAPWARGRGVATAAVITITSWGFKYGLARIELFARTDNLASQRVAIAAGYQWEGCRRGVTIDRTGIRGDVSAWARLSTDPPGPSPRILPDLPGGALTDGVVELRPLGPAEASQVATLRRLPEVIAATVEQPGDAVLACAEAPGQWLAGRYAQLTIWDADSGTFAGAITLAGLEPPTGQAMIGYAMMPAWRGRGFATRAVRLLSGWAFDHAGLARLIAGVAPDNVASQQVLTRAGFRREGYQRGRLPGPAGTRIDSLLYALLSGDRLPGR
jgi:RimJ/RimL family protein N-acetyltransferase